jgi:hypothetical protein
VGEVLAQRLLDLVRACVLALDAVRVVRVHPAQQHAQFWSDGLAGQLGGYPREVMRLGEQRPLLSGRRQQRLELMWRVIHAELFCQH